MANVNTKSETKAEKGARVAGAPAPAPAPAESGGVMKAIDWADFRDHLSTADQEGRRLWLYPRQPSGRYYKARTYLSYLLLLVMFAGPFIRVGGNPLLMMNVVERKFCVLGQVFWPQDGVILAFSLLLFITGIIVFTAAFGRLWCGWLCPQTVLMEMVFRKIEYWIEGDHLQQRALAQAPWTAGKIARKALKQGVFFGLSWVVGNVLLMYIIGSDTWFKIVTGNPADHLQGLGFMFLFTFVFYSIFARFREQACTFICPYGRFQSTLLDENSIVVAYNPKRGETRAPWHRAQTPESRRSEGKGDCVNCGQCVVVCPTGIDIRNGVQMECVHCTACIDACDHVMERVGLPKGLISYASLNGIERGEKLRVTPRLVGYSVLLMVLGMVLAILIFTRSDVQSTLLRAPGSMFQVVGEGRVSNLYTLKVINKTSQEIPIEVRLEQPEGKLQMLGQHTVPPSKLAETSVLIELPTSALADGKAKLVLGVYAQGKRVETLKTTFLGPQE